MTKRNTEKKYIYIYIYIYINYVQIYIHFAAGITQQEADSEEAASVFRFYIKHAVCHKFSSAFWDNFERDSWLALSRQENALMKLEQNDKFKDFRLKLSK